LFIEAKNAYIREKASFRLDLKTVQLESIDRFGITPQSVSLLFD